jgi:hypothetical protein
MIMMQSIAFLVIIFKLLIVVVPAMPALEAFADLRINTSLAR